MSKKEKEPKRIKVVLGLGSRNKKDIPSDPSIQKLITEDKERKKSEAKAIEKVQVAREKRAAIKTERKKKAEKTKTEK